MKNINYECLGCGHVSLKWSGQCHVCGDWNSFKEVLIDKKKRKASLQNQSQNQKSSEQISCVSWSLEVLEESNRRIKTGIAEFDQTLSGGLVYDSILLLTGDPGIGKSTLVAQICEKLCLFSRKVLYVCGEESISQVSLRFKRVSSRDSHMSLEENLIFLCETNWESIKKVILEKKPDMIILDSIQTIRVSHEYFHSSFKAMGSSSQIKEIVFELRDLTQKVKAMSLIIGHINKDGQTAGPKTLEHMVDISLQLKGKKSNTKRELIVLKNRYGSGRRIGLFEMKANGLNEVDDASKFYLLSKNRGGFIGQALSRIEYEGRVVVCEIQSLCVKNQSGSIGARVMQGGDRGRFLTLLAIVEKYLKIPISCYDFYLEISAPEARKSLDQAIVASILSSILEKSLSSENQFVFEGELDLSGYFRHQEENQCLKKIKNIKDLHLFIKKLP